jgi:endonuclease YncB( thermonuclease family)
VLRVRIYTQARSPPMWTYRATVIRVVDGDTIKAGMARAYQG